VDRQLFFSFTIVQVGDGRDTPFWEARWIRGTSPKELAPNLFKLAQFKCRSVRVELHNCNWIKNLKQLQIAEQLDEFVLLFMALSRTNLSNQIDKIFWKWTPDDRFSVASAYDCQFHGSMAFFQAPVIWKAAFDARTRFFCLTYNA
jgi:hypothetical protein